MIELSKRQKRLLKVINKYRLLYQYSNKEEQLLISASILNIIWNSWSLFWKYFFLIYIIGGYDTSRRRIHGLHPEFSLEQAFAFLASNRNYPSVDNRYRIGDTILFYREPNWGDCKIIINLATALSPFFNSLNLVSPLFNGYRTEIDEFQLIRNTFIHLNSNTINNLNSIKCNFSFCDQQNLIDILDTKRLGKSNICMHSMLDAMFGLISNI